jgi:hypothetical protein
MRSLQSMRGKWTLGAVVALAVAMSAVRMAAGGEPNIIEHPQSQIVCAGDSITFSVTAEPEPLSYQWHKKGAGPIDGATDDSYTIDPVSAGDAGAYYVVVTNPAGSTTSRPALLTVVESTPSILEHPQSRVACVGDPVTFCVTTGGGNLSYESYQWRKDEEDIPGAITDCYTIDPVSVDDAGAYDVVVTNACGEVFSDAATLTVAGEPPSIEQDPDSQDKCVGDPVSFSVTASSPGWLEYQWRKDGGDLEDDGRISGATTPTLTIDPLLAEDQGNYDVVVTNVCDSATSAPATLTVVSEGPNIQDDPEGQDKCVGESLTFSVSASGPEPLEYQWRKDGADLEDDGRISGSRTPILTIDPLSVEDQGDYDVVVSNPCNYVTSAAAMLRVADVGPSIDQSPDDQDKCVDESVTFSVMVSGPEPLEYQWRKDGADLVDDGRISGATTAALTIDPVVDEDQGGYDVVVTNPCGSATSAVATLIVGGPRIDDDPNDAALCEDDVATFSVVAGGVRPLEYQWRKDGSDLTDDDRITGATTAILTIDPALPEDTGLYDVVVTNRCAAATSAAATLSVDAKPRVTVQPVSVTIVEGQQHLFCIAAGGAEPLTYQWQKDGVDIEDANVECYLTSEVGTYRCVVTNHCGSTVSDDATLTTVPALSATASTPTPAIKVGDSARLTATPSGGLAPYTYTWSTQQSGQSVTVTPAESTIYTVTVGDSLQQTAIAKVSVTVVSPMVVTARASAYTLAPGESSILTAVIASGGLAPFRYSWSTGETQASITVSPTQKTTYRVTVIDSLDQTADAIVTIAIHDAAAPPSEQPAGEDETDQSGQDVPPDDGQSAPSDTGETEGADGLDQTGQDVPSAAPSGLCPAVGLIAIGLTLLGLWWTRPVTRRDRPPRSE